MKIIAAIINFGPRLLFQRLLFHVHRLFNEKLPIEYNLLYLDKKNNKPKWKTNIENKLPNLISERDIYKKEIEFKFLNESRKLQIPFKWENKKWTKLWAYNLHYFDWAREYIEESVSKGIWPKDSKYLEAIIDFWIDNNHVGKGYGWDSYTISIRARNWIWLFIFCPKLKTDRRIESLWDQLCWLQKHLEKSITPNHYLENLITLIVGSLNFDGEKATRMLNKTALTLKKQLDYQILNDGGHIERSASYHILILDRLLEMAFLVEKIKGVRWEWLTSKLIIMTEWTKKIRLINGNFPSFNDSPKKDAPNIDTVLSFALSYLNKKNNNLTGLRLLLSQLNSNNYDLKLINLENLNKEVDILKNTGWTIIRIGNGWEVCIKWGSPCCEEFPGHCHSDFLSFDVFYKGLPILIETGTSKYNSSYTRDFERSGEGHNIIQISKINRQINKKSNWIEPIQVWGSFRVGRIAKLLNFESGKDSNGYIWTKASHDGYKKLGVDYERSIKVKLLPKGDLKLFIVDNLKCKYPIKWRQNWHEGPDLNKKVLKQILKNTKVRSQKKLKNIFKKTWTSEGFGIRKKRFSLFIYGIFPKGENELFLSIKLKKDLLNIK